MHPQPPFSFLGVDCGGGKGIDGTSEEEEGEEGMRVISRVESNASRFSSFYLWPMHYWIGYFWGRAKGQISERSRCEA